MSLTDILILVLVFVVGWRVGQIHQYIRMHLLLKSVMSSSIDDVAEDLAESIDILYLEIEEVNGIKLLFEKEGNFICQASSIDELAILFNERNNKKYNVFKKL